MVLGIGERERDSAVGEKGDGKKLSPFAETVGIYRYVKKVEGWVA